MAVACDLAHGRLALKGVDHQTVRHYVPVLEELLKDVNPVVFVARAQIHGQNALDVILTVMWQDILESENWMLVSQELRDEMLHATEELYGRAGYKRRFIHRMPQQRINELLRRLTKPPECRVREPPSVRRHECPADPL